MPENLLCYGDNSNFLRDKDLFPDESVDLIYLDPPFNSKRPYNILFKDHKGTPSAAQIKAFDDTWKWDEVAQRNYEFIVTQADFAPDALKALMDTFGKFLGHSEMFAYLVQMATRLVMMHRVLKKTGSLYLHCDPTASHYLKLVLDAVFGALSFKNEIIWKRTFAHGNVGSNFGKIADSIFFYSKGAKYTWRQQYRQLTPEETEKKYPHQDDDGRRWQSVTLRNPGPRPNLHFPFRASNGVTYEPHPNGWSCNLERLQKYDREGRLHFPASPAGALRLKMYADETLGERLQNIWVDIPPIGAQAAERLGYPTQKPLGLLKRIVAASSNPGDVVLDPFCGCGTTIDAVETLNREHPDEPPRTWIGIDITHLAVNLIKHRLARFDPPPTYRVVGEPESVEGARELATHDRYQFEYWALGLIGARPAAGDRKKGADKGIDGSFNFIDDHTGKMKTVLVQVKSGHVNAAHIRDLKGVLEREKAEMGVFITLEEPTKPMSEEAVSAGHYHSGGWGKDYPRMQILTVEQLLNAPDRPHPGCLRTPERVLRETFKEAPKHKRKGKKQLELGKEK